MMAAILTLLACATGGGLPTTTITVKDVEIKVEVADEAGERAQGLQHRKSLPPDEGMVFVYPDAAPRSFWMEYTTLPLSIAFLDAEGRIVRIADMKPLDRTSVPSGAPAMYALEMNQGWFAAHGVVVGDQVTGLPAPEKAGR